MTDPPSTMEPLPSTGPVERPALSCAGEPAALRITVSTAPFSTEACEPGPVDGWLDGSVRELSDGVELILDSCPPTADCLGSRRCLIRIEGIDTPLADDLRAFDYQHLSGWAQPGFVRLKRTVGCCRGPGCYCGPYTVLYAFHGNPGTAAPDGLSDGAEDLRFARETEVCEVGFCGTKSFFLSAALVPELTSVGTVPEAIVVAPRETKDLGESGLRVRLLTSSHDECIDEPANAAFIAWLDSTAIDDDEDDIDRETDP